MARRAAAAGLDEEGEEEEEGDELEGSADEEAEAEAREDIEADAEEGAQERLPKRPRAAAALDPQAVSTGRAVEAAVELPHGRKLAALRAGEVRARSP